MLNMTAIGARIQERRERLGLTAEQLSKYIGISRPRLSHIETGRTPAKPAMRQEIEALLDRLEQEKNSEGEANK